MADSRAKKIAVIAGPTASGKTALAIELAKLCGGEIVSADSMQIYRRMDIGTAKASAFERAQAVHHMIDIAEPDENYSVSLYVENAGRCCDEILERGRLPILAGGTGLYIDSLVSGRDFAAVDGDMALRSRLNEEYGKLGGEAMLGRLAEFDPERAAKLAPSDSRRIVRAIEIYMLTGVTATERDAETRRRPPRYDAARIVLGYKNRADLYRRIDSRVDKMAEDGLFEEVESLLSSGLSPDCTSMQAIGYKEAAQTIRGELGRSEALELIRQNSRRYAKRQLTWFRRWEEALTIEWDGEPDLERGLRLSAEYLSSRGVL